MRRIDLDVHRLSELVNVHGWDVLLPVSSTDAGDKTSNADLNTHQLIFSVDFYLHARPRHLQVFTYSSASPAIDLKPIPRNWTVNVLVDRGPLPWEEQRATLGRQDIADATLACDFTAKFYPEIHGDAPTEVNFALRCRNLHDRLKEVPST